MSGIGLSSQSKKKKKSFEIPHSQTLGRTTFSVRVHDEPISLSLTQGLGATNQTQAEERAGLPVDNGKRPGTFKGSPSCLCCKSTFSSK